MSVYFFMFEIYNIATQTQSVTVNKSEWDMLNKNMSMILSGMHALMKQNKELQQQNNEIKTELNNIKKMMKHSNNIQNRKQSSIHNEERFNGEFSDWFTKITTKHSDLSRYLRNFHQNKCTDINIIKKFKDQDLIDIGINSHLHRSYFMHYITKL